MPSVRQEVTNQTIEHPSASGTLEAIIAAEFETVAANLIQVESPIGNDVAGAGDVNGDGLDDLVFNGAVVFGSTAGSPPAFELTARGCHWLCQCIDETTA